MRKLQQARRSGEVVKYRVTTKLPDGMAQAPPFEVDEDRDSVLIEDAVYGELRNDEDQPFPVGTIVTVERIG